MELEQQIVRWIAEHRERMVADIARLVRIPSISSPGSDGTPYGEACRRALAEMLEIGREHGLCAENYADRVGSLYFPGEGEIGHAVGTWGHLDVVPVGNGWQFAPFEPVEREGYLIGRGAQDNKGPTVGTMYLLLCLRELGVKLRHPVRMFFGCDEERGMSDLEFYRERYPCPALSLIPDSGFPVCYGEKGILEADLVSGTPAGEELISFSGGAASNMVPDSARLTLRRSPKAEAGLQRLPSSFETNCEGETITVAARGVSRHSAFPEGGESAIFRLVAGLAAAELLPEEDQEKLLFLAEAGQGFSGRGLHIDCSDETSGKLTCVASGCSLDEQRRVRLHVNIRYPITADANRIKSTIKRVCSSHGFTFQLLRDSAPNDFPREDPAVDVLTNAYNRATGQNLQPFVMGGGTYARKLPHAMAFGMGLPGDRNDHPMFQPGHGGAHEPDEALKLSSLCEAMRIYCLALMDLDRLDF